MLFVLLFFVGLGANKVIRRQRIKMQSVVEKEEIVYEQTRIVYHPEQKEYEITIRPPPKAGETRDFSIKISDAHVAEITQIH